MFFRSQCNWLGDQGLYFISPQYNSIVFHSANIVMTKRSQWTLHLMWRQLNNGTQTPSGLIRSIHLGFRGRRTSNVGKQSHWDENERKGPAFNTPPAGENRKSTDVLTLLLPKQLSLKCLICIFCMICLAFIDLFWNQFIISLGFLEKARLSGVQCMPILTYRYIF